jgi:hypothetical protein
MPFTVDRVRCFGGDGRVVCSWDHLTVIVRAVPSGTRDTHNKRVLWKTRTTRNFAGFPVFRHTLGIGRCCIARVLKPAERV